MRRFLTIIILWLAALQAAVSQDHAVQNRPYTDLRPFHFGILVGTHLQDLEFVNAGPQAITAEDGTTYESVVLTDQDRWEPGFNVGVLGEFRLSENFQLRIAPAMYFGTRHLVLLDSRGKEREERQQLKTAYISSAFDFIFAGPRYGNHRPYLMAGLNPMINLSGNNEQYVQLRKYDTFLEIGAGCDFYLPFFKLRPELKFLYGLTNSLDKNHQRNVRNAAMLPYTQSVSEAHSKMIVLTFYFE